MIQFLEESYNIYYIKNYEVKKISTQNISNKTNIPNIRILVRFKTNTRLSFDTIRIIFSIISRSSDSFEEVVKVSIKELLL